jgi:hypothetical protein
MWSHDIGWGNDVSSGSIGPRRSVVECLVAIPAARKARSRPQWIKDALTAMQLSGPLWLARLNTTSTLMTLPMVAGNLPYINYVEYVQYPLIVNKNLKNVPVGGYAIGANFSVVQMYFDTP